MYPADEMMALPNLTAGRLLEVQFSGHRTRKIKLFQNQYEIRTRRRCFVCFICVYSRAIM